MTMTPDAILALVNRLYELTGSGQWDAAAELLSDDLVITEADNLPMAGEYRGKDALRQLYTKVFTLVDVTGFETIADCVGGDQCVRLLKLHFGEGLESVDIAEAFEVRDGQVQRIKPYYYNPSAMIAAVAHKQAAAAVG